MLPRARLIHAHARIAPCRRALSAVYSTRALRGPADNADIFASVSHRIFDALGKRHIRGVLEGWITLKERDLHRHLPPTHLARAADLFAAEYIPQDGSEIPHLRRVFLEEVALLASSHSPDALAAYMRYLLARGDTKSIVDVYQKFVESLKQQDDSETRAEPTEDQLSALGLDFFTYTNHLNKPLYVASRVHILLIVITAHAMHNDFPGAVQAAANDVRLHFDTTRDFVEALPDAALRDKITVWLPRFETARLLGIPSVFAAHLRQLGQTKTVKRLTELYSAVVDGIEGANSYIAPSEEQKDRRHTLSMTPRLWTAFLSSFLAAGARDRAEVLWEDMTRFNVPHTTTTWTALIDSFRENFRTDSAAQTWSHMLREGVKPDWLTYRAIIAALTEGKRVEQATRLFKEFQETTETSTEPSQRVMVYNTFIQGLLTNRHVTSALDVFDNMEKTGPEPSIVTYNTIIAYFGRIGDLKNVNVLLKRMAEKGVVADLFTYSMMMTTLMKAGKEDAAEKVISLMQRHNIQANTTTYGTMIVHLLQLRTEAALQGAIQILDSMEARRDFEPGIKTYEAFLAELWKSSGWLPMVEAATITQDIRTRMKARKLKLNIGIYQVLLRAMLVDGYPNGVPLAWELYQEMRVRMVDIAPKTMIILLEGMTRQGHMEYALHLCADVDRLKMKMTTPLLKLFTQVRQMQRR